MDQLLLIKILSSFLAGALLIMAITTLAEQVNPRLAGIITAWPTTLVGGLFSITLATNVETAALAMTVAPTVIAGIMLFVVGFASLRSKGILPAAIGALTPWAICSGIALLLPANIWVHFLFFMIVYSAVVFYVGHFPNVPAPKTRITPRELLGRGLLAGIMMTVIVIATRLGGPFLGGVVVNFPVLISCTLYLMSKQHGVAFTQTMARAMPQGSIGSCLFAVTFFFVAPQFSGWWGFGAGLACGYVVTFTVSTLAHRYFSRLYLHPRYLSLRANLSRLEMPVK